MNKNSKALRKEAIKNYKKGQNPSSFAIKKTMPGSSLTTRTQTITIGNVKRKSEHPKVSAKRGGFKVNED